MNTSFIDAMLKQQKMIQRNINPLGNSISQMPHIKVMQKFQVLDPSVTKAIQSMTTSMGAYSMKSPIAELMNKGIFANINPYPISSAFTELIAKNSKITEQFNGYFKSQSILNSSVLNLVDKMNFPLSTHIQSIQSAFQKTSSFFISDIIDSEEWDDLGIVEDINSSLHSITEEYVDSDITSFQLEKIKTEIIDELHSKISILEMSLSKTSSKRVSEFVLTLMTIIGFYFACISHNNPAITKKELEEELQNFKEEFTSSIDIQIQNYFKERIALTNVNLRISNKKNSKKIGLIKEGQNVLVIEILHKWLLIQYFDIETGEPKTGYVFKKYFK